MKWVKRATKGTDPETQALLDRAGQMAGHLSLSDRYAPGASWEQVGRQNLNMLAAAGTSHFKRYLPQNYFNWPVQEADDPKFAALLRAWAASPNLLPLEAELIGDANLNSVDGTHYIQTPLAARVYALFVGLLWWKAVSEDEQNKAIRLVEPNIGDPIRISLGGRLISQDLANSLREYTRFSGALAPGPGEPKPVLAEMGAGYGRLGYATLQAQTASYWVFDVAPALAVSEWYLEKALRSIRIFRWRPFDRWEDVKEEVGACDACFFTPDQLEHVPPARINTFAAISTLHGLKKNQIDNYLRLMTTTSKAIYMKNWTTWTNDLDGLTFKSSAYKPPAGWKEIFDRPDDVIEAFTEKLWVRTN